MKQNHENFLRSQFQKKPTTGAVVNLNGNGRTVPKVPQLTKTVRFLADSFYATDIDLAYESVAHSFFLNNEVLRSSRFGIHPIELIPGEDFSNWLESVKQIIGTNKLIIVHEGCSPAMVAAAKCIGASVRVVMETKEVFIVVKIWSQA